jgi:tryptophan synthase alpha chain
MQKSIRQIINESDHKILNIYCTAGFPEINSTEIVIRALDRQGVDLIEIGIPFSDPLADGPVIQESSNRALQNGMTLSLLFEQLKTISHHPPNAGLILMGYMNTVLQFGFEKFCHSAAEVGISGIILPDLPIHEYEEVYQPMFDKYLLDCIFLITPETSEERIKKIDSISNAFIYAVTSTSTTGSSNDLHKISSYLLRLKNLKLQNPLLAGFGIQDKSSFDLISTYTAGGIVGSAYIKKLGACKDIDTLTADFVHALKNKF